MSIRILTKTVRKKIKNENVDYLYGVIEGPFNQMLKEFPEKFAFLRHQTKREKRGKK